MLLIRESYTNKTEGYRYGDSEWYEPYTDNKGDLFRNLQREYGRCISKLYRDNCLDGSIDVIGWVFEKRMKYTDCNETFLSHTWVHYKQAITA